MSQGVLSRFCLNGHDTKVCGRVRGWCRTCKDKYWDQRARERTPEGHPKPPCTMISVTCTICRRTVLLCEDAVALSPPGLCGRCGWRKATPYRAIPKEYFGRKEVIIPWG